MKNIIKLLFLLFSTMLATAMMAQDENPKERKGPANIVFNIMEQISADYDFSDEYLFSINEQIFRDKNMKSGYYYYYPTEYSLQWNEGRGSDKYDLNFIFGVDGNVTVTAILKPKVSSKNVQLVKAILKQNIKGKPDASPTIKGFLPLPLATRPEVEFNNLSQFGISEDKVDVRAPADLKGEITMSFTTNRIENLTAMLFNDVGLYGNVIITPDGEDMQQTIAIPFNIKIDDNATYGKFDLNKSSWRRGWTNNTDYPVKLNYLHILKDMGTKHQVYSWDLEKVVIPECAGVDFSNSKIIPKGWDRDSKVKYIWLDYTIQPCSSCSERLQSEFSEVVSSSDKTTLNIKIQNLLEFSGGEMAFIKLRSYQGEGSSSGRKVEMEPIEITNDGHSAQRGPLYVGADQKINFEYKIQIVMPDGTIHESKNWKTHHQTILAVGATQVKNQISHFKNKTDEKSPRRPRRNRRTPRGENNK